MYLQLSFLSTIANRFTLSNVHLFIIFIFLSYLNAHFNRISPIDIKSQMWHNPPSLFQETGLLLNLLLNISIWPRFCLAFQNTPKYETWRAICCYKVDICHLLPTKPWKYEMFFGIAFSCWLYALMLANHTTHLSWERAFKGLSVCFALKLNLWKQKQNGEPLKIQCFRLWELLIATLDVYLNASELK